MIIKNIACLIVFISFCFTCIAQIDSSSLYSKIITGGNTKDWFTRRVIIDNPHQIPTTTLTFKLKPKTGNLEKSGRGRDMLASFRNFNSWKIVKQGDKYLLTISEREKYFLTFLDSPERIMILKAFSNNKKGALSIAGSFFETAVSID